MMLEKPPAFRGKSKDGGECTAGRNVWPVFHFRMHDMRENLIEREFFNRWLLSVEATFCISGKVSP
jgi:hypothetical protein